MSHTSLAWAESGAVWLALDPTSAPSAELTIAPSPDVPPLSTATTGTRFEAAAGAEGHVVRSGFAPVDLDDAVELRVWVRADQATGRAPGSFFAEIRLGSAALPADAPGNGWHRAIPVREAGVWELVRVSLAGLPPAARAAVDHVQVRVLPGGAPVTLDVAGFMASTPEMIVDVDAVLAGLLDGTLVLDLPPATPIPARVHVRGGAEPTDPWLRIVNFDVCFADERTHDGVVVAEHDTTGPIFRRASTAYDLHYSITGMATDRGVQARLLEHVLRTLGPRGDLVVAGVRMPYERIAPPVDGWPARETRASPFSLMASSPELAYRVRAHLDAPATGAPTHVIDDVRIVVGDLP